MPSQENKGTFDTSIKAWLAAMDKANRIKAGGKLLFVNKKTGQPVPMRQQPSPAPVQEAPPARSHPMDELRSSGMVLGKAKKRARK